MTVRANADSKFLLKYLLIGLGCLGFALWSTYDGFINYPNLIPMAEAWENLKSDSKLNDAERNTKYKELASEKNWPAKRPGKTPAEIQQNIVWQYIFIAVGSLIGLPCLIWYLRNRGTWVETKDDGLQSSWGEELEFAQIKQFDKKKWEKKGIGVLTYESQGGQNRFILDDLKFVRSDMDKIVRIVESKIPREIIVNGDPESDVGAIAKKSADLDLEGKPDRTNSSAKLP